MIRRTNFLNWVVLGALLLPFVGCVTPTPYQKSEGPGDGGYSELAGAQPGVFQVDFVAEDRNLAFAQYAAYYRAAELAFQNGYRYFQVLKAYNISKKDEPWGDPKDPVNSTPGVRLLIQCSMERPASKYYDVWQYLNQAKVPGTQFPYPVDQRQGDQANQAAASH